MLAKPLVNVIIGIDGGGTRTTAWLADERGKVLAKAVAGPSNPLKVGYGACEREIRRAASAVVAAVSDRRKRRSEIDATIAAVVVGLAGVDRPSVHHRVLVWLRRAVPARHHLLTSDAAIALHAAVGDAPGITVISGTGSIAYAQDPENNRVLRSGGWGIPYDDAGSGYEIGRQGVTAALCDYDGRAVPTALGKMICRSLKLRKITEIVPMQLSPKEIAALYPTVLRAAGRGDRLARQILEVAACDLEMLALALIRRLGWSRRAFPLVCSGGVLTTSKLVRDEFSRLVRKSAPRARVMLLRKEPVEGALAMARALATDT